MASEDVIELGSSDDEAEPAPKKVKPNVMIHIPHNVPKVAIEPSKSSLPSLHKKLSGRAITITKIKNPPSEIKSNKNTSQKCVPRTITKPTPKCIPMKQALNPISVKMTNSQVAINRVPAALIKKQMRVSKIEGIPISPLPANLTIKKAFPTHRYPIGNIQNKVNSKMKVLPKMVMPPKAAGLRNPVASMSSVGDILTVELDDDDAKEMPGVNKVNGPQWYLRPEEQKQREKMEEENNTEPQSSKFIEITIEDSPVKSANKTHEIGAEFAITIEDSPMKLTIDKKIVEDFSDEENKVVNTNSKPKTKKKLDYLKNNVNNATKTVEIEIEPMEVTVENQGANGNDVVHSKIIENDLELISSEIKEKKACEVPDKANATEEMEPQQSNNQSNSDTEFHPVYQSFIDLCFELENSDDMQKIVEKKIKGYYRQVPKEYTDSEEFLDMVSSKITSMKAGPERMYLYIKDVVDELNYKRKSFKTTAPTNPETNDKEAEKFFYGEESEFDSKRQKQIRKLEKTLKKLHRAIQKLEEQEVDFDDEEDSVYLLTERYKERMIRVHAKFCQLTNTKMPSEPRLHVEARLGQPSGPAKRLEKMINKKVSIGKPLPFPDFHDVLRCVREANEEDKLSWNEADIMDEARDLFMRCGRKLQRRRQENEWRLAASRIAVELDPAVGSDELKEKLAQNKLLAVKKETELFNKYADKQNLMKLEAVEIGDKEAEESPVESEEDDIQDEDISLENSEKRKERLKRLLQEKFTKDNDKNENPNASDANRETILKEVNEKQNIEINMENEESTSIKINSVVTLNETKIDDRVQSVSDDSSKLNSDIDELHLLQKLHSDKEINDSTQNSSDSDSCIAISDSLDSSSDGKKQASEDVISIENSSYSEPETNEIENVSAINTGECLIRETAEETSSRVTKCSKFIDIDKKLDKSNNDEYNGSVENILLASSDEEYDTAKNESDNRGDTHNHLNDDTKRIKESIIKENNSQLNVNISKQKAVDDNLKEVDLKNDIIKSNELVLTENNINNFKETAINSTIDNVSVNADITSGTEKNNINKETHGKQNVECDSVEAIVGSSTEAMEVVTTTSLCDD